jgi:hypothetical protein
MPFLCFICCCFVLSFPFSKRASTPCSNKHEREAADPIGRVQKIAASTCSRSPDDFLSGWHSSYTLWFIPRPHYNNCFHQDVEEHSMRRTRLFPLPSRWSSREDSPCLLASLLCCQQDEEPWIGYGSL